MNKKDRQELDTLYDKYFKYEVKRDNMTGKFYRIINGVMILEPSED